MGVLGVDSLDVTLEMRVIVSSFWACVAIVLIVIYTHCARHFILVILVINFINY